MPSSFLEYLFFVLEIFTFLYETNEEIDDVIIMFIPLKQYNTQSRISFEMLSCVL